VDVGRAIPLTKLQLSGLRRKHRKALPAKTLYAVAPCQSRRQPCSRHTLIPRVKTMLSLLRPQPNTVPHSQRNNMPPVDKWS